METFLGFFKSTGFANMEVGHAFMILMGLFMIGLAIQKRMAPLFLVPLGFGIVAGNIPLAGLPVGVYDEGSVFYYLFRAVSNGIYPPLLLLGMGAMADFSVMLNNPKLVLLGVAAQVGIFLTMVGAIFFGFSFAQSSAVGLVGAGDLPTSLYMSAKMAPELMGSIAVAVFSITALVPVVQPRLMKMLTSKEERLIRMTAPREVGKREKVTFPIAACLICAVLAPGALVLVGCFMFGNLLKESLVTDRLANAAKNLYVDVVLILFGLTVGVSTSAEIFLTYQSFLVIVIGLISFSLATVSGVILAKVMNLFVDEKINPLVGAAGVSVLPDSARIVQSVGKEEDPDNDLLEHALAPNIAGLISSAIAAGVLISLNL